MNRFQILPTGLWLLLQAGLFVPLTFATAPPLPNISTPNISSPNIILMMADDMGMGDTSAYQDFTGNTDSVQVHTPNLERLAKSGIRFTDAHTPSSRCTSTRYGLLTGRYPWRNRMKHWVLFGAQGDPMIEADRPTIASMLRDQGYRTAMVGKWHVGLRYRQNDGRPAAGWQDADLTRPLHTSPVDHGFDFARFTSRSHGTSGPNAGRSNRQNNVNNRGPGHIHDRTVIGATEDGKQLVKTGPNAYILTELGGRHSDHAMQFLKEHVSSPESQQRPFFLYYACNSNHSPYTPDDEIAGRPVAGASRNKAGEPMSPRYDFIYENDIALGRLLDWLEQTQDPRNPEAKLIANTLVVFTSDNGAEIADKSATGPFRSNKGSVYEGGHRVPFIAGWPSGNIGDGDAESEGQTSASPICLTDMYATLAEITGQPLPDLEAGEKGAEDSLSILEALRGTFKERRQPILINDHKEASDPASLALRIDSPTVNGTQFPGQWKLFFDAELIRRGSAHPVELYDLATDPREQDNRLQDESLQQLVEHLTGIGMEHRNQGGHRYVAQPKSEPVTFTWSDNGNSLRDAVESQPTPPLEIRSSALSPELQMTLSIYDRDQVLEQATFTCSEHGLGVSTGDRQRVDGGEALVIHFDRDVLIESASLVADGGACGGFYQLGDGAPLAIYCIDADNDAKDQHGILSDLGLLKAGQPMRLDSRPHFGVENAGSWQLQSIRVRVLK